MKSFDKFIYTIIIPIFALILIANCEDENYFEVETNSDELIDPHSFYYDKQSKKMIKEPEIQMSDNSMGNNNNIQSSLKSSEQVDNHSSHEGIFYKRLINLLLANINIQVKDEVSIIGILEIEVSHSQMEILQNFHVHKTSFREIDEILSNIIKKPRTDYMAEVMHIFDIILQKFDMILRTVQQHPDATMIVFVMLTICLTCRLIKRGQGFPIFLFIQIIFILSFFMTWWHLIQEAEIKYTAAQMKFADVPVACQPNKMGLWDKFISFIYTDEDCEKYYQVKMSNPKLKITPAFALSHFIITVVLHPITHMGTVVSDFINNATDNLPWTYAWIIKCILFICVGFVIIIIPFCLSGASFNLGLGPLLRFGIDYQNKSEKGKSLKNVEKRDPVQILLQISDGTNVPKIKDASSIEQSKVIQIRKNVREEQNNDEEDYLEEFHEDLSCGDVKKNSEFSESDNKLTKTFKQFDVVKNEKNDGSGDN